MIKKIIIGLVLIMAVAAVLSLTVFKELIKSSFYIDHMERDERVERMDVKRIIDVLPVKEGDIVTDIGAGSGLFSRMIAQKTGPSGKVFASDINGKL